MEYNLDDYNLGFDKARVLANKIITKEFDFNDGDYLVIERDDDGYYYAYIKSEKRCFNSMIIGPDFTYLIGNSMFDKSMLMDSYLKGDRS